MKNTAKENQTAPSATPQGMQQYPTTMFTPYHPMHNSQQPGTFYPPPMYM